MQELNGYPCEVLSKGRKRRKVEARCLYCYWAARELGVSLRDLSVRLEMRPPGGGFLVKRGERIASENACELIG
jgi:hypothetical protein